MTGAIWDTKAGPMSLDTIKPTKTKTKPPRVLLYGEEKVGKSTAAAEALKPVFIPTETGLDAIQTNAFPAPKCLRDVLEAIAVLQSEEHDFNTLVIDSLTMLEPLVWDAMCGRKGVESIEDLDYSKGYTFALDEWRELTKALDRLQARGIGCILIGHSIPRKVEEPGQPTCQQMQPNVHAKAAAYLASWADVTGYLTVQGYSRKEDLGFGSTRNFTVSTGERILHLDKSTAYVAGNRYGVHGSIPAPEGGTYAALRAAIIEAEKAKAAEAKATKATKEEGKTK